MQNLSNHINKYILRILCSVSTISAVGSPVQLVALSEIERYELSQYADMYADFENMVDNSDYVQKSLWSKKTKSALKKCVLHMFKEMVIVDRVQNVDQAAYVIADLKRKIDKKFFFTCSSEDFLTQFSEYADLDAFKDRIKFYLENPDEMPTKVDANRYNFLSTHERIREKHPRTDLDDIPWRCVVAGLEIGCGVLLMRLPFPPAIKIGVGLISHGTAILYDEYVLNKK